VLPVPPAGWQRVAVVALLVIPLLMLVILMSPTLIIWPVLSDRKRADFRDLVDRFVDWIKVITGGSAPPRLPPGGEPPALE
jgi:hypothetical protein